MNRKKQILTLIESDILSFKLILTLNNIGVDASNYSTDISKVVFMLMGIKKKRRTETLYRKYFDLIRQVEYLDLRNEVEKSRLSLRIYNYLITEI